MVSAIMIVTTDHSPPKPMPCSVRVVSSCQNEWVKPDRQVKIAIASRKFANGPAATIAARLATDLWWKLPARSSAVIAASVSIAGVDASVSSPKNLT